MNIPKIILNDRKIISSDVYHYYQSLAQKLILKKRYLEINIIPNYSKEKIQNWFSNLSLIQKFKICSIYNNWFSNIIFQMMEYSHFEPVIEFFPTDEYQEFKKYNLNEFNYLKNEINIITNNEKNLDNKKYDKFITFFTAENKVKQSSGVPDDYELININNKFHMEHLFLSSLRFITLDEFNDTISFCKDLFNHPERLFEFFCYFSKNQCFSNIITPLKEKNNIYNFSFPSWIYKYQSYSFCQLLLIFFEQIISVYYQLYLYDKEIPQFNIDKKFSEFFKTNENLKNYLFQKLKNTNDDYIVDKKKYLDIINSKSFKDKYLYYEKEIKFVYSLAFGFSLYEQNPNIEKEFIIKFYGLMDFARKNSNEFIEKISFVESKESFKYLNFIYSAIYKQLMEQCSDDCYQELLTEEKNKCQNEPRLTKSKKNKKKKKKKKKAEKKNEEIKFQINTNIEDSKEEEKIKNKIDNNEEEEIEEIPADYIIHPKKDQSIKEIESVNNNIINNNDINNSTVSSSCTNKYSKDYNSNSLGPRYNNFFKCEKKESEMLLEIKDFSEDKSEESKDENDKNNKIELEDISENDISEENINIKNNNDNKIDKNDNKKKKKQHKKRNKKKKNKLINENINENINKDKNNYSIPEKKENNDTQENNNNEQIELSMNNNRGDNKENEVILKETEEISKISKDIDENPTFIEEKKNKNSIEKENSKEIQKEDDEKHKRKSNKEFFLFPVTNCKKKEKNLNPKKKENINSNIMTGIKKETNISLNKKIIKSEINNNTEPNSKKKDEKEILYNEEKSQNIILKSLEVNKVANITINSLNKKMIKSKENGDNINDNKSSLEEIKMENNLFFLNQHSYQNPFYYENCNNSFFIFQNELYTILGKDILKFQKNVENNLKEIKRYREQAINIVKTFILNILLKDYNIKFLLYGSFSTGLNIESSDVDILIKFNKKKKSQDNVINSIKIIHDLISLLNEEFKKNIDELKIVKINPIYTASIPVLKIECFLKDIIPIDIQNKLSKNYLFNFEDDLLKLNFDFTFLEVDDINKEQTIPSQEIIHYIKESIITYPIIKPIILVLKRYLQINKLNSSYQGGISSFSLFLLVASYNKQIFYENQYLKRNKNFENLLGQILYGFFMFYSNFNFEMNSIDIKSNSPINLLNEFNENKITLIDPITGLNAAKSTFKIEHIKLAFNYAIMAINDIFFKSYNNIDSDDNEKNIIKKLLTTH